MKTKNYKVYKNINLFLIVIAMALILMALVSVFLSLKQSQESLPIEVYYSILFAIMVIPVLELIFFIVCLIFILKDKSWAYFWAAILSAFNFIDGINSLIRYKIVFKWAMLIGFLFWIVLIGLSFYMYSKTKKKRRK